MANREKGADRSEMKCREVEQALTISNTRAAGNAFWLILSRGAILSPRAAGAIAGMLAGLVSTTVLEEHCADLNVWHILVWHLGSALVGMLVGLLVAIAGEAIRRRTS